MAPHDDIQVGDLVNVPGGMYGTVKYLGVVDGKPGRFAGVELAAEHAKRGKNNGDVDGRKYFTTSVSGSGIFVPVNNSKYVTKRTSSSTTSTTSTPPTPVRSAPSSNFSKSVGPGTPAMPRPSFRRPSLPRPESPRTTAPPKLSLAVGGGGGGLRTPSAASRTGPSPTTFARTPFKTPSRLSDRPPSRISVDDDGASVSARMSDIQRDSASAAEVKELKNLVKTLQQQLVDRDKQLEEQAATLAEFQRTVEEFEGPDALSVRAQLRDRNEKIAQLTAEFDSHRADFRSTLDTLEIAASETERVYEQRLEELIQQNKELLDRGEDVEAVAMQLKQLEELVSELEEGLEDARRGEAEARGEVEFLRGEVERTKLELKKERESATATGTGTGAAGVDTRRYSRELDQKDDEIRGLKAIIHSLSRGDTNAAMLKPNGLSIGGKKEPVQPPQDTEHVARLEKRLREFEEMTDKKTYRIEELERELQQTHLNGQVSSPRVGSAFTSKQHRPTGSSGGGATATATVGANKTNNHAHRLSDRTVVPNDWPEPGDAQHPGFNHQRSTSNDSYRRLETMHESDSRSSDDGQSLWCEICETGGHDILSCTNMFGPGAGGTASTMNPAGDKPERKQHAVEDPEATRNSNGMGGGKFSSSQRTGRDAVLEGLKGIGGLTSSMSPVAGKESGVIDESKWCALCERDGHESIDCPFDE